MNRLLLILSFFGFFVCNANALTADSIVLAQQKQLDILEKKMQSVELGYTLINSHLKELQTKVASLTMENEAISAEIRQKQQSFDSLAMIVVRNSQNIQIATDSLGLKIQTTDSAVTDNTESLKTKTKWGVGAFIFALLASIVVWLLHKKGQKKSDVMIASLKRQADELNEKIVNQFSIEIGELQKLSDGMKNAGGSIDVTPDHSLVKTLADRITFMEMTLYRMDKNVKGHKQLSKSITQMKDNLLANGYEIVDMLGKEYDDGMKATASFVEDDSIETGKQIITGIVKPQINYKGVMIQSAQITVSQN